MFRATILGLITGLGLSAAGAVTLPAPVAAVIAGLEKAGFTDVRVTERIFGGFAIQGRKGAEFALIAMDAQGRLLDHAELFRDADNDGVFETDETLGTRGQTALRDLVIAALAAPAGTAEIDLRYGDTDVAGFKQGQDSLFAPGGLQIQANETLGSGGMSAREESVSLDADQTGYQRRGARTVQQESMAGFGLLSLSATAALPGGIGGAFAPLTIDTPQGVGSGVNEAEIRSSVAANAPDAAALQASITAAAPNATALTASIVANAPTAEQVRAGISAPTAPVAPASPAAP